MHTFRIIVAVLIGIPLGLVVAAALLALFICSGLVALVVSLFFLCLGSGSLTLDALGWKDPR